MKKELFNENLKLSASGKSGKPSSYIKAMEIIEEIYFSQNLIKAVDVWDFITIDNIDVIYQFTLQEQKKEDGGVFKLFEPKSYWQAGYCSAALAEYKIFLKNFKCLEKEKGIKNTQGSNISIILPKPFLLLAGISGTGKTRFAREQAKRSCGLPYEDAPEKPDNYELVAVRPDWHEPSDLLGYVSRISKDGPNYVPTKFLEFLIKAWQEVFKKNGSLTTVGENTHPFWLCLDEMNLAPVEQYFADYLSILETRKWAEGKYSSLPLVSDNLELVMNALGGSKDDQEWKAFFEYKGIPLPPNLIVAGTVNMDETTHGFSRKVIDRALTIDFQEFFPNKYDEYFDQKSQPVVLSFPTDSQVSSPEDLALVVSDSDGSKSIAFLSAINENLKSTPFELAYRALNELLLAVKCFAPKDARTLCAVWDDFLMQKVLPRIEGDSENLKSDGDDSGILMDLKSVIESQFKAINKEGLMMRPDLLNEPHIDVSCRSIIKINWMQERLKQNHYTSFWT